MNLSKFNAFSKQGFLEECKTFFSATFIALIVFGSVYTYDAYAQAVVNTLTVTVAPAVTFTVSTASFGTLTPATPLFATSTLSVSTNATGGWNITLFGNNQGSGAASTTLYLSPTTYATNIADGAEWIPAAATTSAGNAVAITSGDDFLYFRVMTASGSVPFRAATWWGTDDTPFTNARWAGIASSTVQRKIGSVSSGFSTTTTQLNTVQYYLDVPASQPQGLYTGDLTYTWASGS